MKHLKLGFLIALAAFTLSSCKNTQMAQTILPDSHSAKISLDWQGTYSGNLACADCDYIETELTLTSDLNYVLTSKHIGKANRNSETLKGKFIWQGNNVKLIGIPENERPSMYKVEENRLRQLDLKGNIIRGELAQLYLMHKNGNTSIEDKRWQLVELNGQAVQGTAETYYIIFHSADGRLEAKANCNVMLKEYKIKNELQIKIEPGITTLMACPDNLEKEFSEVLATVDNLSTDGKTLSLNKARMAALARFELVRE